MSGPASSVLQQPEPRQLLWHHHLLVASVTGAAFLLYYFTAAPGLTWAHFGADGGELLAAAVTNGVPHPPGYPLYMLLLRGWLWLGSLIWPTADLAWRGNLFSLFCATLSVGVTVHVAAYLLRATKHAWLWAALTALAWSVAPLPWSQALITEVYAMHMLLVTMLGWALFVKRNHPYWLVAVIALGTAHHLTFILLMPAVLFYCWFGRATNAKERWHYVGWMALGGFLGLLLYLRTPWAASQGLLPSPVNWGYPDNWQGFWWLVSGAAYRSYLFGAPSSTLLFRIAAWASTLTNQLTPVGLAVMLVGLSQWDRQQPLLRNFSLIWLTPISVYAINYYTRDSEIYLLPVIWLAMLWFGVGLASIEAWLTEQWPTLQQRLRNRGTHADPVAVADESGPPPKRIGQGVALVALVGLLVLAGWRWPTISARTDTRAETFVHETLAILEPRSIIISSSDAETFSLWYSAWGSGELLAQYPDTVLINYALYQFPWYQRLVAAQYPTVVGESRTVEEILAMNADRPIFFSEHFSFWPAEQMEAVGPIWRYVAP